MRCGGGGEGEKDSRVSSGGLVREEGVLPTEGAAWGRGWSSVQGVMRCRKHLKQALGVHLEVHGCSSQSDMGAAELGVLGPLEGLGHSGEVTGGRRKQRALLEL